MTTDAADLIEEFFCRCNQLLPISEVVKIKHHTLTSPGLTFVVLTCRDCASQSLCNTNMFGLHGKVLTPEDDEYDPWAIDWNPPKQPNHRRLSREPQGPPNDYQYGYCAGCFQPMRWNADGTRWRWEDYLDARPSDMLRVYHPDRG